MTLKVANRFDDRGDIMRLELVANGGANLPDFEAGAHIDLLIETKQGPIWRQYSLYGDPNEKDIYRLGILRETESRGGSQTLHEQLQSGNLIQAEGPKNLFPLEKSAKLSVLFAGGIGITPMLAMAYQLCATHRNFQLHYCTRDKDRTAFLDLLENAPFKNNVILHHDTNDGAPSLDLATAIPEASPETHIYVCGPKGFMEWVIEGAQTTGLGAKNIHREYFTSDVELSGQTFEVYAAASDVTVTVGPDDTIAKALAAAGVHIEVKCEEGVCGTCVSDVLEGTPDHRDSFLDDDEREEGELICACCSRATSTRIILDV